MVKNNGLKTRPAHNILCLLAFILLNACTSLSPTREELDRADYGSAITQENAQTQVMQFFENKLENNRSTQYRWGDVEPGWVQNPQRTERDIIFGYVLDVQVNGRNTLGGETGYIDYKFVFHDGQISHVFVLPNLSNDVTYMGKIY